MGLDIGTTSISIAVIDENNRVVDSLSRAHNAFIETPEPWAKIQNAEKLLSLAMEMVEEMYGKYKLSSIGVTGQQHGIAYLDAEGNVLSPLYTWQDARALQKINGKSCLDEIKEKTGLSLSAGFGLATHYYNQKYGLVPENAVCFATIADIAVMRLTGRTSSAIEASNAHSFGMFDIAGGDFDRAAVSKAGMDVSMLPRMCSGRIVGEHCGIPVAAAIGDNQASFIGAVSGDERAVLVNEGTGGQISLHTDRISMYSSMELRPYPLGGYLLAGSSLCGGRAWALTERFFRESVAALTGIDIPVYEALEKLLDNTADTGEHPRVNTCFDGTRSEPDKRGSIEGISIQNFTPGQFALGILHGMAEELYVMYEACLNEGLEPKKRLIGSGNGLRLNKHLRRVMAETFGMPLEMSVCVEEASVGAAIFSRKSV